MTLSSDVAEALLRALLLGSTAIGFTLVIRRMPPVASWVRAGRKPFACNLCCSTWTTLALTLALGAITRDPWTAAAWLPALGISTIGLHHADPPPPPDFDDLLPKPFNDLSDLPTRHP